MIVHYYELMIIEWQHLKKVISCVEHGLDCVVELTFMITT